MKTKTSARQSSTHNAGTTVLAVDVEPILSLVRSHTTITRQQQRALKQALERLLQGQLLKPALQAAVNGSQLSPEQDVVLTTQQAAEFIGVSRPYIAARVDAGDIPLHQKVGNQRRVLRSELLAWRQREQARLAQAREALYDALDEEIFR